MTIRDNTPYFILMKSTWNKPSMITPQSQIIPVLREALLALLTAAMLAVCFPPRGFGAFAWLALVPLLRLRRQARGLRLMAWSYVAILGPAMSLAYAYRLPVEPTALKYMLALLPPALFAIAIAITAAGERRVPIPLARVLVFPLCATVLESALPGALRHIVPVPSLAWSQNADSMLVQIGYTLNSPAPVTFLIVLVNVGLEESADLLLRIARHAALPRRDFAAVCLIFLLFSANVLYGLHRISTQAIVAPTASGEGTSSGAPEAR